MRDPDGEGLAFIQGGGPKKDSAFKGKVECWHCGGLHYNYKNKCPELKVPDTGIQNLIIKDCDKEHNLFLADDGYGLCSEACKRRSARPPFPLPHVHQRARKLL